MYFIWKEFSIDSKSFSRLSVNCPEIRVAKNTLEFQLVHRLLSSVGSS